MMSVYSFCDRILRLFEKISIVLVICLPIHAGETGPDDPRQIKGDIWCQIKNDTLYVKYDIRTDHFVADSIFIFLPNINLSENGKKIYTRSESTGKITDLQKAIKEARNFSISGTEIMPDSFPEYRGWCAFSAFGRDEKGEDFYTHESAEILPNRGSFVLQLSYGYGEFKGDKTKPKLGKILSGLGLGVIINGPKHSWLFEGSGNFGGSSNNYMHKWSGNVDYTYFTGERTNYLPAPFLGVEFSEVAAKYQGQWLTRDSDFGLRIGVGLHGRFERLTYSYHTANSGYHSAQLMMAISSAEESRVGTVFGVDFNGEFATFTLTLRAEGLDPDGMVQGFHRMENRPWWHRALSYTVTAPFMPIVGLLRLFGVKR